MTLSYRNRQFLFGDGHIPALILAKMSVFLWSILPIHTNTSKPPLESNIQMLENPHGLSLILCFLSKNNLLFFEWRFWLWASLVAQRVKNLPSMQKAWVQSLGQEDPLEQGMATQFSILAWKIPWTEESGWLWSTGSQTVGHDRATNTFTLFTSH